MAEAYSGKVVASGLSYGGYRVYVNARIDSEDADSVTVYCGGALDATRASGFGAAGNAVVDGNVVANFGGVLSNTGYGWATFAQNDGTIRLQKGYTQRNITCTANGWGQSWGGYGSAGGGTSVSVTLTIPAKERPAPHAPESLSVSRVSDTRQNLTWKYTSGQTSPWEALCVNRAEDGGKDTEVAVLWTQPATNWADTSTSAGHRYDYHVRAYSYGKYSSFSDTVTVYTAPTAPNQVSATKDSSTSVRLECYGQSRWYDSVDVQVTSDGGKTWTDISSPSVEQAEPDHIIVGVSVVPAGTITYRVRLVKSGLAGAWTQSNSLVTITPPLAPAITGLEDVYPVDSTVSFSWVPNHPDGSAQTAAQVEITSPDGTPETQDVSGATTSASVTVGDTGTWKVRVRTKGLHADWGAWSTYQAFNVAVPPQGHFTNPATNDAVVDEMPLEVTWSATSADGVSSQYLLLDDMSAMIAYPISVAPSDRSATVRGLENHGSYRLTLTIRSGSGLSVKVTRTFTTEWKPPAEPVASATTDSALAAHVMAAAGTDEDAPKTTSLDVWRVNPDGTETLIGSGLYSGQQVIDRLPPLNVDFSYRAVAHSEMDTTSSTTYSYRVNSDGMEAFNFGDDASVALVLGFDAKGSSSVEHSGETFHFALGKNTQSLPTFYPDGDIDVDGSHSYVVHGAEEYNRVRGVVYTPGYGICWFRDGWGNRARCVAKWSLGYDAKSYLLFDVKASLTEVVWEEPSNG